MQKTFDLPSFLNEYNPQMLASIDCLTLKVDSALLLEVVQKIQINGFVFLMDLTAVDWGVEAKPRFMGVYHFYDPQQKTYLRIHSDVLKKTDGENCEFQLPSISHLFPAANWHERETFDMFGIIFTGHSNLKRILMWEGYPYYPLRKDFPLSGIDVPLPCEETTEATKRTAAPAPMEGGPFCATPGHSISAREPVAKDSLVNEKFNRSF